MSIVSRLINIAKRGLALNVVQQTCAKAYFSSSHADSVKKSVFISQSNDIFTNLALENWFYRYHDFSKHHVLLLWQNDPCIVFGRNQNPWLECNVPVAKKQNITLARRNSGGGTVYHDNGNLNLTFFTPRKGYNRKYNLNIIVNALFRHWGVQSMVNKRDDIILNGCKISGTAARVGSKVAYHHCTLLLNVNKIHLSSILEKKENDIITNATTSVRSPIKNLFDVNHTIQMNKLLSAIGWEYLRTKPFTLEDGKEEQIKQQYGFQFINPSEDWFPGINEYIEEFRSWNWNFGKTPKFTVSRSFDIPTQDGKTQCLSLSVEVEKGIMQEIRINLPTGLEPVNFPREANVISDLRGTKYHHEVMENIIAAIGGKTVDEPVLDTATL